MNWKTKRLTTTIICTILPYMIWSFTKLDLYSVLESDWSRFWFTMVTLASGIGAFFLPLWELLDK